MNVTVIGIAGGTGSGKSTLVKRLQEAFHEADVATLCHDYYYKAHPELSYEERTSLNYDHPQAFDTDMLVEHIRALKNNVPMNDILSGIDYSNLLLGIKGGSFGELAAFALILGGIYLLIRKVITWHTPVAVLGSMALFAFILNASAPESYMGPAFHLLTGGALLGALFMATDYSSSPMTHKGMLIYGVGIGVITMLIRVWGAYPEGMSFAILIMNAVAPLINKYVKPRRFGMVVK